MRKFFIALALLLTVLFLILRFAEVQNIAATIERGNWRFLTLALLVQAIWMVDVGASYRAIFRILGIRESLWHLVKLSAAVNFFNIVAPSGGLGGLMIFFDDARKNGYSSARATVAGALFVLFDYAGFLVVLALGLTILSRQNHLGWPEVVASIFLFLVACGLAGLLYLGTRSSMQLGDVLAWLAGAVNWAVRPFIRRDYLSVERAYSFAEEAADGINMLKIRPRALILPYGLALSNKALLVSVLFLVFLSFGVPFTVGTLIAGFSMGYLFLIVSPTPSGIGVVEGVMTLSLHTLGVPLESAAVVVLAYRGFTFWAPFLAGMATFRNMAGHKQIKRAEIN
jgi:glycosyltransferase 2 family protein